MAVSLGIQWEEDSAKSPKVYRLQVFARIAIVKDIYSFAEYLGAAVRDIIRGYHSETIQKTETGAHHDSDRAQA